MDRLAYMTIITHFFNKHFQYFPLICRQKLQFTVQTTDD